MGLCYIIKCRECGNEEHYNLARGYMPLEEFAYEEIQEKKLYEKLRTVVKSPEGLYDSLYKIYYCEECKTLENHIFFKVRNMQSFRIQHKCRKCSKVMTEMNDLDKFCSKEKLLNCPKCGAEDIFIPEENFPLFWD